VAAFRQCSRQSFRLSALHCIHRVHCCCVRVQLNLYVCGAIHIRSFNSARFLIPSQISLFWLILFSFIISSNNVYKQANKQQQFSYQSRYFKNHLTTTAKLADSSEELFPLRNLCSLFWQVINKCSPLEHLTSIALLYLLQAPNLHFACLVYFCRPSCVALFPSFTSQFFPFIWCLLQYCVSKMKYIWKSISAPFLSLHRTIVLSGDPSESI